MRKLLSITLFSFAIMASATTKNEIVIKKSNEVKNEKNTLKKAENSIAEEVVFFGCSSQGNFFYDEWRAEGYSHREARSLRRAFVRMCRDGSWQF